MSIKAKATTGELRELSVDDIDVVVLARPLDQDHVGNLAASMDKEGLLQPITVYHRGDRFILGPGQHRLAAAKRLAWPTIPAFVNPDADDRTIELHQLIENLGRLSMNPIEEARSCERLLKEYDGSHDRFAAELGKPQRWLDERMSLLRLSERVRQFVADRTLPLAHALVIAQVADHAQQEELAATARGGKPTEGDEARPLSLKKTRALVEKHLRVLDDAPWDLDVPFADKPACSGCPQNSRNVPELFPEQNACAALCLNRSCFAEKTKFASAGTRKVVSKLKRTNAIEDAVAKGPSVFEEALRDFKPDRTYKDDEVTLDPTERAAENLLAEEKKGSKGKTAARDVSGDSTSVRKLIEENAVAGVVRDVKADYLKASALHHAAVVAVDPSQKTAAERKGDEGRKKRSKLEKEWIEVRDKWNRGAQQLVGAELRNDPLRLALYTLLMSTRTASALMFDVNKHVEPTKEQAAALETMRERLEMLKAPGPDALEKAAKILAEDQPDIEYPFSHHETPSYLTFALADAIGVEVSPLPTMESLEAKRNAEVQQRNAAKAQAHETEKASAEKGASTEGGVQPVYGKKSKLPQRKKKKKAMAEEA